MTIKTFLILYPKVKYQQQWIKLQREHFWTVPSHMFHTKEYYVYTQTHSCRHTYMIWVQCTIAHTCIVVSVFYFASGLRGSSYSNVKVNHSFSFIPASIIPIIVHRSASLYFCIQHMYAHYIQCRVPQCRLQNTIITNLSCRCQTGANFVLFFAWVVKSCWLFVYKYKTYTEVPNVHEWAKVIEAWLLLVSKRGHLTAAYLNFVVCIMNTSIL